MASYEANDRLDTSERKVPTNRPIAVVLSDRRVARAGEGCPRMERVFEDIKEIFYSPDTVEIGIDD